MHVFHAIFSGRVQGIGFRYTTMSIAHEYEVIGWVRNRSDGTVEVFAAHSEKERLENFVARLRSVFSRNISFIKTIPSHSDDADGISGFRILETR